MEISKALKDSVLIDRYMGWSHAGNTRQKYQHYYNDDSFDAMLTVMDGLKPQSSSSQTRKGLLKPRICSNCSESNKPESKFCTKCKFVLTFDAFNEATQESEKTKQQIESMQTQFEELKKNQEQMYEALQAMQVIKDVDEEQKKLLVQSDRFRQSFLSVQQEQQEEEEEEEEQKEEERIFLSHEMKMKEEKEKR